MDNSTRKDRTMSTNLGEKIAATYAAVADLAAAYHLSEDGLPDTPNTGDPGTLCPAINWIADVLERTPRTIRPANRRRRFIAVLGDTGGKSGSR